MDIIITLLVVVTIVIMLFSIMISRQLSIIVLSVILIGLSIIMVSIQGFTQKSLQDIGIFSFLIIIGWHGLSFVTLNTTEGRDWLEDKMNQKEHSTCKVCGKKMSYHKIPRNMSQILLGGLTCNNCGNESNIPLNIFTAK